MDKSLEEFQHYIYDANFPASKEEVASSAEDNGAPQDLVWKIRNTSKERFDDPQQVLQVVRGSL